MVHFDATERNDIQHKDDEHVGSQSRYQYLSKEEVEAVHGSLDTKSKRQLLIEGKKAQIHDADDDNPAG